MELIVIGSGTGVPSLRRGSPALALKAAGRLLVLDLGPGTLRALLRLGLNFSAIDVLALTHLHPDHVGDLIPFLFATRYSLGYTRREPFRLLAADLTELYAAGSSSGTEKNWWASDGGTWTGKSQLPFIDYVRSSYVAGPDDYYLGGEGSSSPVVLHVHR